MSLLDKASLIQIPSGYKNGKLYSVKPTPTYGSELVTNGDFTTDSDWTKGSGWTIVNGEAVHTGSGDYIEQGSLVQGTKYRVVIVVTQASASAFPQIYMGGLTTAMQSPNTYTFDITAQSGDKIKLRGLFDCKVDSISVKEILVADGDFDFSRSSSATRVNSEGLIETAQVLGSELMPSVGVIVNLGGGTITQISGNSYSSTSDGTSGSTLRPKFDFNTTSGKTYKLVITPIGTISGTINFDFYDGTTYLFQNYDFTTTKEIYFTDNGTVFGAFDGTQTYSISNFTISVKEVIENDVPRLDYSGGATCPTLLLEPQRTNLQTYSEDLTNGAWITNNASVVPNQTTSPDGTTTADKVDYGSGSGFIRNGVTLGSATTFSIFIKYFDVQWVQIMTSGDVNHYANFDVQNGVLGNVGSSTEAEIEDYGNGWYRIVAKFVSGTFTGQPRLYKISSGVRPWAGGDGDAGSYYMWGGQQEVGAFQTSYIPTTSSTVTRTADVCNNAGTSATFNSTEGVLFAEIAALVDDGTNRIISLSEDGNNDNRVTIFYTSGSNKIKFTLRLNGANEFDEIITLSNILDYNKVALKFAENNFAVYINGVKEEEQLSGSTYSANTLDKLSFDKGNGTFDFYGKCKQLMVFDEALSDEELSDLTGQANYSFAELAAYNNYTIL